MKSKQKIKVHDYAGVIVVEIDSAQLDAIRVTDKQLRVNRMHIAPMQVRLALILELNRYAILDGKIEVIVVDPQDMCLDESDDPWLGRQLLFEQCGYRVIPTTQPGMTLMRYDIPHSVSSFLAEG